MSKKNTQSKIKPIKLGKRCKDYTHNFRPQAVKMRNKVLREKSNCVVCQSNKSKQKLASVHRSSNSFFQITKHAYVL